LYIKTSLVEAVVVVHGLGNEWSRTKNIFGRRNQ